MLTTNAPDYYVLIGDPESGESKYYEYNVGKAGIFSATIGSHQMCDITLKNSKNMELISSL